MKKKCNNYNSEIFLQSPQSHSQDDLNSPSDLTKEEDDDDEDELEDRIEMTTRDPERLKAFNVSFIFIKFLLEVASIIIILFSEFWIFFSASLLFCETFFYFILFNF